MGAITAAAIIIDTTGELRFRTSPSGTRAKAAGCYGIQVDGTDFSEVIAFQVTSAG